jgi:hypothetical protein
MNIEVNGAGVTVEAWWAHNLSLFDVPRVW